MYRRLFVFIEGTDDFWFVEDIIKYSLSNIYEAIDFIEYARETHEYISNYLKSINQMNADYIFLGDINSKPCVTEKKNLLFNRFKNLDLEKIIIVIKEIESWYLAGLSVDKCNELEIKNSPYTNDITKEDFENIIKDKFDSKIDAIAEILSRFSIEEAKRKNNSFKYFADKYNIS